MSPEGALQRFLQKSKRKGDGAERLVVAALVGSRDTAHWAAAASRLHAWIGDLLRGRATPYSTPEDLELLSRRGEREALRIVAASNSAVAGMRRVEQGRSHRLMTAERKVLNALAKPELAFVAVLLVEAKRSRLKPPSAAELMFLAVGVGLEPPTSNSKAYNIRLETWTDRLRQARPASRALSVAVRRRGV